MQFREYPSIENSYRGKTVSAIGFAGFDNLPWVATEKVHGANYSLWFDGTEVKPAKRSSFIGDGNFYGSHLVMLANEDKVRKIFDLLSLKPGLDVLTICGEIFGGGYPHPDVPQVQGATKVQDGVFYTPDNRLYAFDIQVNDQFINYDKCMELFESVGMFYAKPLARGTYYEVMQLSNEFQTTIPKLLGLPDIENNVAEGYVAKPVNALFFDSGRRVILKNKNNKFSEKAHKAEPPVPASDKCKEVFGIYSQYICENRLNNVLSKLGPITNKDFGLMIKSLVLDAREEYVKDHSGIENDLTPNDRKILGKLINEYASRIVRPKFLELINED